MKHEPEQFTLNEIVNVINYDGQWYDIIDIQIEGLAEAYADGESDDFEKASKIEADYLKKHGDDLYLVHWPEHVLSPRFDTDASYQLIL